MDMCDIDGHDKKISMQDENVVDDVEAEEIKLLEEQPVDFEEAIAATGFGKFNLLLGLVALPTSWTYFELLAISYVIPTAQCDLELTLEDKGIISAASYAGSISSAFLWGFLFDTFGRRKLLMIGFFLNAMCVCFSSFTPNKEFFIMTKFAGGFLIGGPYFVTMAYLSEFHVEKYRSRIPLLYGSMVALGRLYLPVLAAIILPLNFKIVFAKLLVLHSWGLFLLINALPAFVSGVIFIFLPESPKYLMSMGKNKEALNVFQKIYSINTGKLPETYPIKALVREIEEKGDLRTSNSLRKHIRHGWTQIKPLFQNPHIRSFVLVCLMNVCSFLCDSSMTMWTPQIFQAINDYKFLNNGTTSDLCEMINMIRPSKDISENCFVNFDNSEVYVKSVIVVAPLVLVFLVVGIFINLVGPNRLLHIFTVIWGCAAVGLYFAPNAILVTLLICVFNVIGLLCIKIIQVKIINMFPTSLRAMAITLSMMAGMGSASAGNMGFAYLLKLGCVPPFMTLAALSFACFFFSLFLPEQKKSFV